MSKTTHFYTAVNKTIALSLTPMALGICFLFLERSISLILKSHSSIFWLKFQNFASKACERCFGIYLSGWSLWLLIMISGIAIDFFFNKKNANAEEKFLPTNEGEDSKDKDENDFHISESQPKKYLARIFFALSPLMICFTILFFTVHLPMTIFYSQQQLSQRPSSRDRIFSEFPIETDQLISPVYLDDMTPGDPHEPRPHRRRMLDILYTPGYKVNYMLNVPLVNDIVISPDGNYLFMSGAGGGIHIADASNPNIITLIAWVPAAANARSVTLSADGNTLFVCELGTGLFIFDVTIRASPVLLIAYATYHPTVFVLNPVQNVGYLLSSTGTLSIINLANLSNPTVMATISSTSATQFTISPDGKTVYVAAGWYGIQAYNVTNPASPSFLVNFPNVDNQLNVAITPDGKTLICSNAGSNQAGVYQSNIQLFNITTISSVYLITTIFDIEMTGFQVSADGKILYIAGNGAANQFITYDISDVTSPQMMFITSLSISPTNVAVGPNPLRAYLVLDSTGVVSVDLDSRTISDDAFQTPVLLNSITGSLWFTSLILFRAETTLIVLAKNAVLIYDVRDRTNPMQLSSVTVGTSSHGACSELRVSADGNTIYAACGDTGLHIIDITTVTSPSTKAIISTYTSGSSTTSVFLSSNGAIAYVLDQKYALRIFNVSNKASPTLINTVTTPVMGGSLYLHPNGVTLFVGDTTSTLLLMDVSNPLNVTKISQVGGAGGIRAMTSDTTIAYACRSGTSLVILNITNLAYPFVITSIAMANCYDADLSADETTLYVSDNLLKVIDVSNPTTPLYTRSITPLGGSSRSAAVTADKRYLFISSYGFGWFIYNFAVNCQIPMQETYLIGESIVTSLLVRSLSQTGQYVAFPGLYKISSVLLYFPQYTSSLPAWMILDANLGTLTIAPTSESQIGDYTIVTSISNRVPNTTFIGVGSITNASQSLDLYFALIIFRYIDTDGYVTSLFNPATPMLIGSSYSSSDEPAYRSILQGHLVQMMNPITVNTSLNVTLQNTSSPYYIDLADLSQNSLTVVINLSNGTSFINLAYSALSVLSNGSTIITITGSLSDVRKTLKQLRINLNGLPTCDGSIYVSDGANPDVDLNITQICDYFLVYLPPTLAYPLFTGNSTTMRIESNTFTIPPALFTDQNSVTGALSYSVFQVENGSQSQLPGFMAFDASRNLLSVNPSLSDTVHNPATNGYLASYTISIVCTNSGGLSTAYNFTLIIACYPPILKKSLQEQVNRYTITTGSQFDVKFDDGSFIDVNGYTLNYVLSMVDQKELLPEWIQLKSFDLIGTAPSQFNLKVQLKITASNGIQSVDDDFEVEVEPSPAYVLQVGFQYFLSALGFLGILSQLNNIYNVLCKRRYRYPQKFFVQPGFAVTHADFYPIAFLAAQLQQAKLILKEMKKSSSSRKLSQQFLDPETKTFDPTLVAKLMENVIKHNKKFSLTSTDQIIIQQLVIDEAVRWQLNLRENKLTRTVFNRLKRNWMNLVEPRAGHYSKEVLMATFLFQVNQVNLSQALKAQKVTVPELLGKMASPGAPSTKIIVPDTQNCDTSITRAKKSFHEKRILNVEQKNSFNFSRSALPSSIKNPFETQTFREFVKPEETKSLFDANSGENTPTKNLFVRDAHTPDFHLLNQAIIAHARMSHNMNISSDEVDFSSYKRSNQEPTEVVGKVRRFLLKDLNARAFDQKGDSGLGIKFALTEDALHFEGVPQETLKNEEIVFHIKTPGGRILRQLICVNKVAEEKISIDAI